MSVREGGGYGQGVRVPKTPAYGHATPPPMVTYRPPPLDPLGGTYEGGIEHMATPLVHRPPTCHHDDIASPPPHRGQGGDNRHTT